MDGQSDCGAHRSVSEGNSPVHVTVDWVSSIKSEEGLQRLALVAAKVTGNVLSQPIDVGVLGQCARELEVLVLEDERMSRHGGRVVLGLILLEAAVVRGDPLRARVEDDLCEGCVAWV